MAGVAIAPPHGEGFVYHSSGSVMTFIRSAIAAPGQKRVALFELVADLEPAENSQLARVEAIERTAQQRARFVGTSDRRGAFGHAHAVIALDPDFDLRVGSVGGRLFDERAHRFAIGRRVEEVHRDRAALEPSLAERLQQDRRKQLEVNRSGDSAAAKTELGRGRVIVDAAGDFAGVVDGSPQRADEHMIAQFDFRIHDAVLETDSSTVSRRSANFSTTVEDAFPDPFERVLISTRGDFFSDRTGAWTRDLLASLGRADISNQHALQITGSDPVIATRFRAGEAAAAVLAADATAAADLWCARGGRPQRIEVDVRAAAASLVSFAYLRYQGASFDRRGQATTALYRARDGRWIHLHGGFSSREGTLELLKCDDDAGAIAKCGRVVGRAST